jgi:hypothetical protein
MGGARVAGVYWHDREQRWRALISVSAGDGKTKQRYLGIFVNEEEAALAYDQAAREHHGDKAQLNFSDLPPQPQVVPTKASRQGSSQYRGEGRCTRALGRSPCRRQDSWRCT